MSKYKISGTIAGDCTIYIFQNNEYRGRQLVSYVPPEGHYSMIFQADSSDDVIAVARKESGLTLGFGEIVAVSESEPVTVSGVSPEIVDGGIASSSYNYA